jgi:hypothetical protein
MPIVEYEKGQPFPGVVGRTADESPFAFTGTIDHVTIDVSGELIKDDEAELRSHLARQ